MKRIDKLISNLCGELDDYEKDYSALLKVHEELQQKYDKLLDFSLSDAQKVSSLILKDIINKIPPKEMAKIDKDLDEINNFNNFKRQEK